MKPYSDWIKIDLHIHTNKSNETKTNDYKGIFDVDTLYTKLKNNVDLFSLTDHNIINVDVYEKYLSEHNKDDDPQLLLGIELDVLIKEESFHTLVIFQELNIEEIKNISTNLENKYVKKNQDIKERKLTFDDIHDLFKEYEFIIIPHANKNENSIVNAAQKDGLLKEIQTMVLLQYFGLEKTKETHKEIFNNGFNNKLNITFQNFDDIPYINFSDNHNINKYPCHHKWENNIENYKICYIKGKSNFESIRFALIDPKHRIKKACDIETIEKDNIDYIQSLTIPNYNENECNFEFRNQCKLEFSPHLNVFIGGRSSGKSLLMSLITSNIDSLKSKIYSEKLNRQVKLKLKSSSGVDGTVSLNEDKIIYIKQGEIVEYFEKKDLTTLIQNKQDTYDIYKNEFKNHSSELEDLCNNLVSCYKRIYDIHSNRKYEVMKSDLENGSRESFTISLDIHSLKANLINKNEINTLETQLEKILTFLSGKNTLLKNNDDDEIVIESFKGWINTKLKNLKNKEILIKKQSEFIDQITNIHEKGVNDLDLKSVSKARSNENLDGVINNIRDLFQKAYNLKIKSKEFDNFDYIYKKSLQLNKDIEFVLKVDQVDGRNTLTDFLCNDVLNTKKENTYSSLLDLINNKCDIKNHSKNSDVELKKKIEITLSDIHKKLKSPDNILKYSDGTTSEKSSPGANAEKYLDILLGNESVKFIFIDQPEDNLGNNYISKFLIKKLREIKFKKQIFLVTHNPSIVVYGDAEAIFMANNDNKVISYKPIILENGEFQKEICSTLDGGEYIFKNRSNKYNINRLKRK
ncbi:MAG: hypothetical protein JJV93_01820 [Alphaproteobacteria bacterium]|nr:hypothetical protein [Alphaproteobacteria bacterium]